MTLTTEQIDELERKARAAGLVCDVHRCRRPAIWTEYGQRCCWHGPADVFRGLLRGNP